MKDDKNYFICTHCNEMHDLTDSIFKSYFKSVNAICPSCNKPIDLWDTFMGKLNGLTISFGGHYSLLGCIKQDISLTNIESNKWYKLDLKYFDKRIDKGELLYINFFPNIHSIANDKIISPMLNANTIYPNDIFKELKKTQIYILDEDLKEENQLDITYWYVPKEIKEDLSNMLLLDAFKFFFEKNYRYMIISAHSSVEIILNKFFEKIFIENNISKNKTKRFLKDAVTYSYQLDPLLHLFSSLKEYPVLNKEIVEGLKALRKDRNNIIHSGETDTSDETKLKKELVSAFLAFKYFKIIHNIE